MNAQVHRKAFTRLKKKFELVCPLTLLEAIDVASESLPVFDVYFNDKDKECHLVREATKMVRRGNA